MHKWHELEVLRETAQANLALLEFPARQTAEPAEENEGKNKTERAHALPLQVIRALHGPSSAHWNLQLTAWSPITPNQNVLSLWFKYASSSVRRQNHLCFPKFAVLKMLKLPKLPRTVAPNLPLGPPALRLWRRHLADVLHAVHSAALLPTTTRKCCVDKV